MIKEFKDLSDAEQSILLHAPAWLSVLASCSEKGINRTQKHDAVHLSHLKTVTAHPALLAYYREVEKSFEKEFDACVEKFYPFSKESIEKLRNQIKQVYVVAAKLEPAYRELLLKSFQKYETHVKRAGHSILEDFIFPIHIEGLTK